MDEDMRRRRIDLINRALLEQNPDDVLPVEIRLGDDKGIRYQGKNYIKLVDAMRDLRVLYEAFDNRMFTEPETIEAVEAIKKKWGLES